MRTLVYATVSGMTGPRIAARPPELTIRGIVLGAIITMLFTAANVYAGLKVGLTFATSIPAAVVSMAILRAFSNTSILENNIVQTIASAAGTLAAIVFVLPGLIMVGWWSGFPYWTTVAVCATGGVLGVMFSVPLRRALVTGSTLPYPEGVAAAEVLKIGSQSAAGDAENARGLRILMLGSLFSAGFALLAKMRVVAEEAGRSFAIGGTATGFSTSWSMLLIGVGHLVGVSVGAAMFLGMLVSWTVLVPWFASGGDLSGGIDALVGGTFRGQVRFVGAGTIGVAAIWSLLRIIGPIVAGLRSALAASRARGEGAALELSERDLPIGIVAAVTLATLVPIAWLLWSFSAGGPVHDAPLVAIGGSLIYIVVVGVLIAAVCGYMAGLIGASNSPVSGVGILAVLGASLLLVLVFGSQGDGQGAGANTDALVAYALFTTAIIFSIATISNDNLQDLKTGQLVGATPWKQQVALVLGVVFGSLAIPLVLDLLKDTLGFVGMPGAGPNALSAPQAALISSIAKGVLGGDIDWGLIGLGAGIGVAVIALDEALGRAGKMRIPPLAVGMGIYLPMGLTLLIPIGAVIGHIYNRWAKRAANPEFAERIGVLAATGLIVGESLFGVAFAGILAWANRASPIPPNDAPLAVMGEGFAGVAMWIAPLMFFGLIAVAYALTRAMVRGVPAAAGPESAAEDVATYR